MHAYYQYALKLHVYLKFMYSMNLITLIPCNVEKWINLKQFLNYVLDVVFSYGGMLSAYMRFKYPNLVAGSIAASAPIYLLSANSKRDFFWEDVTKVINLLHLLYINIFNFLLEDQFFLVFILD